MPFVLMRDLRNESLVVFMSCLTLTGIAALLTAIMLLLLMFFALFEISTVLLYFFLLLLSTYLLLDALCLETLNP